MALRWADGFDEYTTVLEKWNAATNATIVAGALRTGVAGLRLSSAAGIGNATLTIDAQGIWIVGVAFRVAAIGGPKSIIRTLDAGAQQGTVQLNADGTLSVTRAGTVVATSASAILPNVHYYIELKHIILNAGGTLEVKVNGSVWATFAGDTQATPMRRRTRFISVLMVRAWALHGNSTTSTSATALTSPLPSLAAQLTTTTSAM